MFDSQLYERLAENHVNVQEDTYSDHRSDKRDCRMLRLEIVAIAKLRTCAPRYPGENIFDFKKTFGGRQISVFPGTWKNES